MTDQQHKVRYKIHGMHCASCEVLIERSFKKVPGVKRVSVNHANGKATVVCSRVPDAQELQDAIKNKDYRVTAWESSHSTIEQPLTRNTTRDYKEIGIVFFIIVAVYVILRQYRMVPEIGVSDTMGLGFVFVIGLVAAMSTCIAVTGGLLVAVAAKYNETHPGLTGWQRMKPNLYFNAGRVVSYTILGGIVGAIGSALTLSPKVMGFVTIGASMVMIILGFQLLKFFSWMRHLQPRMPKFLAHRIHNASGNQSKAAPFMLGASTFFLPCGFTQALQLFVLSKGDWKVGAATMLVFSLGTLPALLSLSALSSFAKGGFQRYFLKFSGVLVILLGIFNMNNGLALTGSSLSILPQKGSVKGATRTEGSADPKVRIVDGKQVVTMAINGYSYSPAQFTVRQGVPVVWQIDGSAAGGCARVITSQSLNINEYIQSSGITTIEFTPQREGTFPFSCPMGMTTRGASFIVVPSTGTVAPSSDSAPPAGGALKPPGCDPAVQRCATQKVSMSVTREQGFYPNAFTVKKDLPVDLSVDVKVPLGGCMGTMVISDYSVAKKLSLGANTLTFTPTRTGRVRVTCSMGNPLAEFTVTE